MRVIHLVQDRGIGPNSKKGAAVHVRAMCDAFRRLGADVVSIHAKSAESAQRQLGEAFEQPVDVVYERYALGAFEGSGAAMRHGVPHVLEVNAPLEEEARRWRGEDAARLDSDAEQTMFQRAEQVLCVSELVAEYAAARGARESALRVRPNAVDADLFRPRESAAQDRAEWFPELNEPFVLGFYGRLRPWHGLERIVDAAGEALARGVNLAMVCVGEGEYGRVLGERLPPGRWKWEPWCDQAAVARWVAGFHAVPFGYDPSQACYFSPLKLREAMAAGAVPLVPRLGELAAAVGDGAAGIVFDATDPDGLRDAIVDLAQNPEVQAKLSRAARESVLPYTWKSIGRDILDSVVRARA